MLQLQTCARGCGMRRQPLAISQQRGRAAQPSALVRSQRDQTDSHHGANYETRSKNWSNCLMDFSLYHG